MYYIVKYSVLYIIVSLLQIMFFSNLDLGFYLVPLIYISFVVLLPMELASIWVLLLGLIMGISMDFLMVTAGVNTIVSLFTAYFRRRIIELSFGKAILSDGGIPSIDRCGFIKMMRYVSFFTLLHCSLFVIVETLSVEFISVMLLQIFVSSLFTIVAVLLISMAFERKSLLRI